MPARALTKQSLMADLRRGSTLENMAADEIERLRAELLRWKGMYLRDTGKLIEELETERTG